MRTARDFLRLLAAASALSIASVHVAILDQHLEEKPYVGALFLGGILALQLFALMLAQPRRDPLLDAAAWLGGSAIAVSMFALFIVSRTVGLPGYREPWDAIGIAALVLEGLLLTAAGANLMLGRIAVGRPRIERDVAAEISRPSVPCFPSPQIAGAASLGSRDRPESRPA